VHSWLADRGRITREVPAGVAANSQQLTSRHQSSVMKPATCSAGPRSLTASCSAVFGGQPPRAMLPAEERIHMVIISHTLAQPTWQPCSATHNGGTCSVVAVTCARCTASGTSHDSWGKHHQNVSRTAVTAVLWHIVASLQALCLRQTTFERPLLH